MASSNNPNQSPRDMRATQYSQRHPGLAPPTTPWDGPDQPRRYEDPDKILADVLSKAQSSHIKLTEQVDQATISSRELTGTNKDIIAALHGALPASTNITDRHTDILMTISAQVADLANVVPAAFKAGFAAALESEEFRTRVDERIREMVAEDPGLFGGRGGGVPSTPGKRRRASRTVIEVPKEIAAYVRYRFAFHLGVVYGSPKAADSVRAGKGIAERKEWPGWEGYGHRRFITDGVSIPPVISDDPEDDPDAIETEAEQRIREFGGNEVGFAPAEDFIGKQGVLAVRAEAHMDDDDSGDEGMEVHASPTKRQRTTGGSRARGKGKGKGKGKEKAGPEEVLEVLVRQVARDDRDVQYLLPRWQDPAHVESIVFKHLIAQGVRSRFPDRATHRDAAILQAIETYWGQATLNYQASLDDSVRLKLANKAGVNAARARQTTVASARDIYLAKSPLSYLKDFPLISKALAMRCTLPALVNDDLDGRYIDDNVIDEAAWLRQKQLGVTDGPVWEAVYPWWLSDDYVRYAVVADIYGHQQTPGTKGSIWHGPRFRAIAPDFDDDGKKKLLPVVPARQDELNDPMDGSGGDLVMSCMVNEEAKLLGGEHWVSTLYPSPAVVDGAIENAGPAGLTLSAALALPQYAGMKLAVDTAMAATFKSYEIYEAVADRNAMLAALAGAAMLDPSSLQTQQGPFVPQMSANAVASGSGTSGIHQQGSQSPPDMADPTTSALRDFSQLNETLSDLSANSGGLDSLIGMMEKDAAV